MHADVDVTQRKLCPHPFTMKTFVAYSRLLKTVNSKTAGSKIQHLYSAVHFQHHWIPEIKTAMV